MLYIKIITVCIEIRTEHMNAVWAERRILSFSFIYLVFQRSIRVDIELVIR